MPGEMSSTTPTLETDTSIFLAYAARVDLPPASTLYTGTHYEYTTQRSLARYGLELRRIGGRSDGGIDLLGHWTLPSDVPPSTASTPAPAPPLKILVQCKAIKRPAGPQIIRELEGAFAGAPVGWRVAGGVLGAMVVPTGATKGVREAMGRSSLPLAFFMVGKEDGRVEQCLWNQAAVALGLEGLGVTRRYREQGGGMDGSSKEAGLHTDLALTWRGTVVPPVG
ncbi:MAG: hypothetical protein M1838_002522 [Thelocarpon superellum]|nr:MAG: hypothetical protein M1838_002522 [Thelocarpon superellum]